MKITVERERCLGAGQCMMAAPDFFDLDDDGLVVVLREDVDDAGADQVRDAVTLCPARVIQTTGS